MNIFIIYTYLLCIDSILKPTINIKYDPRLKYLINFGYELFIPKSNQDLSYFMFFILLCICPIISQYCSGYHSTAVHFISQNNYIYFVLLKKKVTGRYSHQNKYSFLSRGWVDHEKGSHWNQTYHIVLEESCLLGSQDFQNWYFGTLSRI